MSDDLPLSPEQWRDVVQSAAVTTGHADEVIVSLESTMTGWRVSINPVRTAPAGNAPEAQ